MCTRNHWCTDIKAIITYSCEAACISSGFRSSFFIAAVKRGRFAPRVSCERCKADKSSDTLMLYYGARFTGELPIEIEPGLVPLVLQAASGQSSDEIGQMVRCKEAGLTSNDLAIVELLRKMQVIFPRPGAL
jgi:hypothetical protein